MDNRVDVAEHGTAERFGAEVEAAARRLAGVAERTPLQRNARLSEATRADVWVKREDLQVGRSYKIRGAYNTISQLDAARQAAGVVCASAGNHGQGVAYACRALGVHGSVVVPGTTPRQKRDRIAALGGETVDLVVTGDTYDEAAAAALAHSRDTGATLVPAFDAVPTVVGQATVALEFDPNILFLFRRQRKTHLQVGISAVIDPVGRDVGHLALGQEAVLDSALPVALPPTVFARWRHVPLAVMIVLASLAVLIRRRREA